MNIEEKNGIYYVSGVVDEDCKLNKFNLPPGKVKFDLSGTKSMNSIGLREWVNGLAALNVIPTYINCPHFFVLLLNILRDLFGNNAVIESFQIPATCTQCGNNKTFIATLGKDFFPGKTFTYKLPKCENDGGELETDSDLESDYHFIQALKP